MVAPGLLAEHAGDTPFPHAPFPRDDHPLVAIEPAPLDAPAEHAADGGPRPSVRHSYLNWATVVVTPAGERIGPSTAAFFQAVIDARPHPEQGFRTCLGILAVVKSYGAD